MESKYKIKIICGFRENQEYTIDANEAHKAYWLFSNPDHRTTFKSGLSLLGADIRRIVPDYISTMGWNESHKLSGADYNELRSNGVEKKLQEIMALAKNVADVANPEEINTPLLVLKKGKYTELSSGSSYAQELLGGKN